MLTRISLAAVCALLALPAWAETATTTTTTTSTTNMSSPKAVCDSLVAAAKNNDFKTFESLSWEWSMPGHKETAKMEKQEEQGFHKMHQEEMARLKDLKCGEEKIAGNTAMVEAEMQNETRLIPFINRGGTWKFDPRTYVSFYRDSIHETMMRNKKKATT